MNNAVSDAAHFVSAMFKLQQGAQGDGCEALSEVITRYDEEVVARGAKEVDVSHRQTEITHKWEEFYACAPVIQPSSESALRT